MITDKNYSLSTQSAYVFLGKFSSFVIAFIVPIILVRLFNQAEYGVYQQMLLISMFFVEITKWGTINSLFYFYPLEKEKRTQLLSQTFYFLVIVGIICLPIIYLLRFLIADLFSSNVIIKLMLPVCLYFFFMLTSLMLDNIFILEKKSKLVFSYEIINKTFRVILLIGVALLYKNIYSVIWALSIFAFLRSIFLYIYLKINYRINFNEIKTSFLLSQLRYSFPIGAARFIGELGKKIDKLVLAVFFLPAQFAIYSVAHFSIPFINLFYSSIAQVIIPKLTTEKKNGNNEEVIRLWHKMILQFSIVTIPTVIFFEIFAEEIFVILFTEKYLESAILFRIFLIIMILHIFNPSVILRACNKTRVIFISHLAATITAIILSYLLIVNYGMAGGAIAFVISSGVRTLIQYSSAVKILSLSFNTLLPWNEISRIIIYSVLCAIIPLIIIQQNIPNILQVCLAGFFYFAILGSIFITKRIIEYEKLIEFTKTIFS